MSLGTWPRNWQVELAVMAFLIKNIAGANAARESRVPSHEGKAGRWNWKEEAESQCLDPEFHAERKLNEVSLSAFGREAYVRTTDPQERLENLHRIKLKNPQNLKHICLKASQSFQDRQYLKGKDLGVKGSLKADRHPTRHFYFWVRGWYLAVTRGWKPGEGHVLRGKEASRGSSHLAGLGKQKSEFGGRLRQPEGKESRLQREMKIREPNTHCFSPLGTYQVIGTQDKTLRIQEKSGCKNSKLLEALWDWGNKYLHSGATQDEGP